MSQPHDREEVGLACEEAYHMHEIEAIEGLAH